MVKLVQAGLLLALVLGFVNSASAALLIEPVVGFNASSKAEIEIEEDEGTKSYSGGGGLGFGGRLGYQYLGFQLGLDYLHSSIDMGDDDIDKNVNMDEWAGFVGFEFPVFFRVYAGYIFSATADTKINGDVAEFEKGSGTKVGLGFTGLPFLDINFEYRAGTFKDYKLGSTEMDTDMDYNTWFLGLSLPFNL